MRLIPWFVVGICLLAALACNLDVKEDDAVSTSDVSDVSGVPPTIQILSPASGQQVHVGQKVEIRVLASDPLGVERVQLSTPGRTISTKSFPEVSPEAEALLLWQPKDTGVYELSAVAFRGTVFSEPVTITLEVLDEGDPITNAASGQVAVPVAEVGECNGRILIGNLHIRTGPGTSYDQAGQFTLNEQLTVIGQNADGSWIKIRRLSGDEYWVINNPEWVELTGDACANLPVTS